MSFTPIGESEKELFERDDSARRVYLDFLAYIHEYVARHTESGTVSPLVDQHIDRGIEDVRTFFGTSGQIGETIHSNVVTATRIRDTLLSADLEKRVHTAIEATAFLDALLTEYECIRNIRSGTHIRRYSPL